MIIKSVLAVWFLTLKLLSIYVLLRSLQETAVFWYQSVFASNSPLIWLFHQSAPCLYQTSTPSLLILPFNKECTIIHGLRLERAWYVTKLK